MGSEEQSESAVSNAANEIDWANLGRMELLLRNSEPQKTFSPCTIHSKKREWCVVSETRKYVKECLASRERIAVEFWTALLDDPAAVSTEVPRLMRSRVKNGIPAKLRGSAWLSLSSAHDTHLEPLFDNLSAAPSAFDKAIKLDIGRTYPNQEMFQEGGEGQKGLLQVLRTFGGWDGGVGYCQGLAFIVGPMLLNMSAKEAFCLLVRLMESYGMREMYTTSLSGLTLRLFQLDEILKENLPKLHAHLECLGANVNVYATQWFLAIYACTAPMEFVMRIYDVLLMEGYVQTTFSVALALLSRNTNDLLGADELDQVLKILLSGRAWEAFASPDDLLDCASDYCISTETLTRSQSTFESVSKRIQPEPLNQQKLNSFFAKWWDTTPEKRLKSQTPLTSSTTPASRAFKRTQTVEAFSYASSSEEELHKPYQTAADHTFVQQPSEAQLNQKEDPRDMMIHKLLSDLEFERNQSSDLKMDITGLRDSVEQSKAQIKSMKARLFESQQERKVLQAEIQGLRANQQSNQQSKPSENTGVSRTRKLQLAQSNIPSPERRPSVGRRASSFFSFR